MEAQTTRNNALLRGIFDPIIADTEDAEKQRRFALANLMDNVKRQIEAIQQPLIHDRPGQYVSDETVGHYINLFIGLARLIGDYITYCPITGCAESPVKHAILDNSMAALDSTDAERSDRA